MPTTPPTGTKNPIFFFKKNLANTHQTHYKKPNNLVITTMPTTTHYPAKSHWKVRNQKPKLKKKKKKKQNPPDHCHIQPIQTQKEKNQSMPHCKTHTRPRSTLLDQNLDQNTHIQNPDHCHI